MRRLAKTGFIPLLSGVWNISDYDAEKRNEKNMKKSKKVLDFLWAIWSNAIISLGADEKTHWYKIGLIAL